MPNLMTARVAECKSEPRRQLLPALLLTGRSGLREDKTATSYGSLKDVDTASDSRRDRRPGAQLIFDEDGGLTGDLLPVACIHQPANMFPKFRVDRSIRKWSSNRSTPAQLPPKRFYYFDGSPLGFIENFTVAWLLDFRGLGCEVFGVFPG